MYHNLKVKVLKNFHQSLLHVWSHSGKDGAPGGKEGQHAVPHVVADHLKTWTLNCKMKSWFKIEAGGVLCLLQNLFILQGNITNKCLSRFSLLSEALDYPLPL